MLWRKGATGSTEYRKRPDLAWRFLWGNDGLCDLIWGVNWIKEGGKRVPDRGGSMCKAHVGREHGPIKEWKKAGGLEDNEGGKASYMMGPKK